MEVSGELHVPAALPSREQPRCPLDRSEDVEVSGGKAPRILKSSELTYAVPGASAERDERVRVTALRRTRQKPVGVKLFGVRVDTGQTVGGERGDEHPTARRDSILACDTQREPIDIL